MFGFIRGLKCREKEEKLTPESIAQFLYAFRYAINNEEALKLAKMICPETVSLSELVGLVFSGLDQMSEIVDIQFKKLGVEEIDLDVLKDRINAKALGNGCEENMWVEYIDLIEDYYNIRNGKNRKIGKDIFMAFHILYGMVPNTNMKELIK